MHASPASGGRRLTLGRAAVLGALTGVLLIAAVMWLTGGFAAAEDEGPPLVGARQQVDMERFQVRVEKAVVRPKKGAEFQNGSVPYLDIGFTVTNTSDSTAKLSTDFGDDPFTGVSLVYGGKATQRDSSVRVDGYPLVAAKGYTGRTATDLLQPGLPTIVVLTFKLPDGRPPAQPVKLTFSEFERHSEAFTGAHSWQLVRDDKDFSKSPAIARAEIRYTTAARP